MRQKIKLYNMKTTFIAKQDIEFKVPDFPRSINTTSGNISIENLSEENIASIFDLMKINALEYKRGKETEADLIGRRLTPEAKISSAAGKVLANKIG